MTIKIIVCTGLHKLFAFILSVCMLLTSLVCSAHEEEGETIDAGSQPGVIFSELLPDVPGKRITVVRLEFGPKSDQPSTSSRGRGHRHPGSAYVYVAKGTVRWGIEGEPVKVLQSGDSFFEPPGVLHTVAENASTTEPATVIAVLILPDGAPLLTVD